MNYPIHLSFKILALASQIYIRDANGALIGYVKQKMFKLKEDIGVFADENKTELLYKIKADRIIDFSASYRFTDAAGNVIGSIKRKGMRSILKAQYMVFDANDRQVMDIHEENAWIKVIDSFIGEIPILGMFSGYVFNPAYIVSRMNGENVMRLQKEPAFLESKFKLSPQATVESQEETLILLGVLTMTLLERMRG
ncbi:MAG: hypothetical protein KDB79_06610 [Acidobacteria bacterium]|nr:hypothetical protein [Acidobacteriota bacterium]